MILSVSLIKLGSEIIDPLDKSSKPIPDKLIAARSPILTNDVLVPCV